MIKKKTVFLLAYVGCLAFSSTELQSHSHYGDYYEFGRFYDEKRKALDRLEAEQDYEKYRECINQKCSCCCYCTDDDDEEDYCAL